MAEIIVQGFPYDKKSSFLKGASKAPPLIREKLFSPSSNTFAENGVDINNAGTLDKGDFKISDYFEIEKITSKHLDEELRILTLGGDHSITFPIVKAFAKIYPRFDILQIDAHTDLYDEFEGDKFSHACPMARIMEGGFATHLVQIGIRTLNTHHREQAKKFGVEVHEMRDFKTENITPFKNPVYISIDLDGFDPAFAPGVSHPEPGGLSSRQVIDVIHGINQKIIGADVVEYNPDREIGELTVVLAAKIMKEILGKMAENNSKI